MTIFALTRQQIAELRLIKDEDDGFLARGDPAGLCGLGLAKPPQSGMGYYKLTKSGEEARQAAFANGEN